MPRYTGAVRPFNAGEQRRDVRSLPRKADDFFRTAEGGVMLSILTIIGSFVSFALPLGSLLFYSPLGFLLRRYTYPRRILHDMPLRVPKHAFIPDGSFDATKSNHFDIRKEPHRANGQGVTYLGIDRETMRQVYLSNSDDRTHMMLLGTTGSGKTEFIFALLVNQFAQNSGFIFVDAKGDINAQRQVVRLARRFCRQDDVLSISFATSGRDLMQPQTDKMTNTFNIMSSTSSAMLIELLSGMLDDSGGGGDMWQGRAIAFIAAITRPLTYLRDRGYIQLSPSSYIQYMELSEVEKLVFKHDGMYGPAFDDVLSPLRSYILSLPGYDRRNIEKGQEQKTNEQFGFITMQLTRVINDLSYNYGHIFGRDNGGDIDIFDVVINRRAMSVLLPSMERAPATLKMLGKLIVGSIKQMMAGSLGNRMEGLTRMTVDSRPTNATNAFKIILDEWGYIVVVGASVMPAQARGLGISMVFAAQSYTDIMRGSKEEAEATWDNTTVKVCGRLTAGEDAETYRKIVGVAGKENQIVNAHYDVQDGLGASMKYKQSRQLNSELKDRVTLDDLSQQENGEFTVIMAKKYRGGQEGGTAVVRILGFYTAGGGETAKMYLNDLVPVMLPDKENYNYLIENRVAVKKSLIKGDYSERISYLVSSELSNQRSQKTESHDAISTLFHIQDIIASQSASSNGFSATDIVTSVIKSAMEHHKSTITQSINLIKNDEIEDSAETAAAINELYKQDPAKYYEDYDMDDVLNEEQLGDSSLSHISTIVMSQVQEDALLNNVALGYIEENKDYDIRMAIENNKALAYSQFSDPHSETIFAFYSDKKSRYPFISPEQRQRENTESQEQYQDKLLSIEHNQIVYCNRPVIASGYYSSQHLTPEDNNTVAVHLLINDFSRNNSVQLFEKLNQDIGIVFDHNTHTAINEDDIIYQSIVNKAASSAVAQQVLFEALTHDYPQKPVKSVSDLVGGVEHWGGVINDLRQLGDEDN